MRLLLDTHVVLAVIEHRMGLFSASIQHLLADSTSELHVSTASLWEMAIKWRLGKLNFTPALDALPELLRAMGIELVPINEHHALSAVDPEPLTRDPFDRLLLAQCQIEGLRFVTVDRALIGHRLVAKG